MVVIVAACIVFRGKKKTAAFSRVPRFSWSAHTYLLMLNHVINFREDDVGFIAKNEGIQFNSMDGVTTAKPSSPAPGTAYNPPPVVSQFTELQCQPLSTPPVVAAPYSVVVQHTQWSCEPPLEENTDET